jgi:hypothetical protein
MNSTIVNVLPKDYITTYTASTVELRVTDLVINSSVTVNVLIKDSNGNIFQVQNITLSGEEYNNWGNSDTYLVNTVLSKLGLTPVEPETPVEPQNKNE